MSALVDRHANNTVHGGHGHPHQLARSVRQARRTNVQLILSQHDCRCALCVRSGNCTLQKLANDHGLHRHSLRQKAAPTSGWDYDSPADPRRKQVHQVHALRSGLRQGAGSAASGTWSARAAARPSTSPAAAQIDASGLLAAAASASRIARSAALRRARRHGHAYFDALHDPDTVTVVQVAPAVRAAWGEAVRPAAGQSRRPSGWRRLCVRWASTMFLTPTSRADLTIMEEGSGVYRALYPPGSEHDGRCSPPAAPAGCALSRRQSPQYCWATCPRAKSPQQMFGAIAKTYFAEKMGIDPAKICCRVDHAVRGQKGANATLPSMDSTALRRPGRGSCADHA